MLNMGMDSTLELPLVQWAKLYNYDLPTPAHATLKLERPIKQRGLQNPLHPGAVPVLNMLHDCQGFKG